MRFSGATVQGKWAPNAMARFTLPVFVLTGAAAAYTGGVVFFGDAQLRRLHANHMQDKALDIEGQKYIAKWTNFTSLFKKKIKNTVWKI